MRNSNKAPKPAVRKSKGEAILLGLVVGPLSWFYTYDKDKVKLWVGLAFEAIAWSAAYFSFLVVLEQAEAGDYGDSLSFGELAEIIRASAWEQHVMLVSASAVLLVRAWLLLDRSLRPAKWYRLYPKRPLSQILAIVAAVLLTYNSWLYTYDKDKAKFWLGFGVTVVTITVLLSAIVSGGVEPPAIIALLIFGLLGALAANGIYIWVIVETATRSGDWYRNYPEPRQKN